MMAVGCFLSVVLLSPVVAQFHVEDWHDPHGTPDRGQNPLAALNLIRSATHTNNPLLQYARFPSIKPPFGKVKNEHIVPAMNHILEGSYKRLRDLEKVCQDPDFVPSGQMLVDPAEVLSDELETAWAFILQMASTTDSEELRVAVRHLKPKVAEFNQAFAQSVPIYEAFKKLKRGPLFADLPHSQKRIVQNMIRDLKVGGAELAGIARERFNYNAQKLIELG